MFVKIVLQNHSIKIGFYDDESRKDDTYIYLDPLLFIFVLSRLGDTYPKRIKATERLSRE